MADSDTANLVSVISPETILESRLAFQKDANAFALVRKADLTGLPTKTASFPMHVVAAITKVASETTDNTTNSTMTPTDVTLVVVRRSARIDLADLAAACTVENINQVAGQVIGKAKAKQVDTDILSNMTTNWTSSVGATNSTAITPENILSAGLKLKNNEADENLVLAITPNQEYTCSTTSWSRPRRTPTGRPSAWTP